MPYNSVSEVPDHVPKDKREQWMAVWNKTYQSALNDGKSKKEAEAEAFRMANGVVKKTEEGKAMTVKVNSGTTDVKYTATASVAGETCSRCLYFDKSGNHCLSSRVAKDPNVPADENGQKIVSPGGWCTQHEDRPPETSTGMALEAGTNKANKGTYRKFIPFVKVDAARREVSGIVTAEVPDKDDEVCDYDKSKPYYQAVIDEMSKATGGKNFFPLREMHQLSAVGKCLGFEFKDRDREIHMTFKVVDDDAWKKVDEGVYTGFSQGGRKVGDQSPDPVYKGCMRYVADPSEVSLVDNPCLGVAHFTYVKADSTVEIRKFQRVEESVAVPITRLDTMIQKALQLRGNTTNMVKAKTKRVAGEDLPASAFAYVGDPDRTETWKLPIKFSTDDKTKSHIRNAIARFSSTKGIPSDKKDAVWQKIVNAAKQHGIEVSSEKALINQIQKACRRISRVYVNRVLRTAPGTSLNKALSTLRPHIQTLDDDLGRLGKGMFEVSCLAGTVQELSYLVYAVINEQQWEDDDDSPLPEMINEALERAIEALLEMVQEETSEMREEIQSRLQSKE